VASFTSCSFPIWVFSPGKMGMTARMCFHSSTVLPDLCGSHLPHLAAAYGCQGCLLLPFSMSWMGVPVWHGHDAKNDSNDEGSANCWFDLFI